MSFNKKLNYSKLMKWEPTLLGQITNSKGQIIEFAEDPIHGDEASVICICRELEWASHSDFFETDDMEADHKEYEPWFNVVGELRYGDL